MLDFLSEDKRRVLLDYIPLGVRKFLHGDTELKTFLGDLIACKSDLIERGLSESEINLLGKIVEFGRFDSVAKIKKNLLLKHQKLVREIEELYPIVLNGMNTLRNGHFFNEFPFARWGVVGGKCEEASKILGYLLLSRGHDVHIQKSTALGWEVMNDHYFLIVRDVDEEIFIDTTYKQFIPLKKPYENFFYTGLPPVLIGGLWHILNYMDLIIARGLVWQHGPELLKKIWIRRQNEDKYLKQVEYLIKGIKFEAEPFEMLGQDPQAQMRFVTYIKRHL